MEATEIVFFLGGGEEEFDAGAFGLETYTEAFALEDKAAADDPELGIDEGDGGTGGDADDRDDEMDAESLANRQ